MSHEHSVKAVASQIKSVAGTGTAKMMGSSMENMSLGSMMSEGMRPTMKTSGVVSGAIASASVSAGKSAIKKIFTQPLVLFGLGVIVGCCVYKYRKSILSTSDDV